MIPYARERQKRTGSPNFVSSRLRPRTLRSLRGSLRSHQPRLRSPLQMGLRPKPHPSTDRLIRAPTLPHHRPSSKLRLLLMLPLLDLALVQPCPHLLCSLGLMARRRQPSPGRAPSMPRLYRRPCSRRHLHPLVRKRYSGLCPALLLSRRPRPPTPTVAPTRNRSPLQPRRSTSRSLHPQQQRQQRASERRRPPSPRGATSFTRFTRPSGVTPAILPRSGMRTSPGSAKA